MARDVCVVGFFFVQDVVVDECDGSRGSGFKEVFSFLVAGGDVLRSGGYAGRSHFAGCVPGGNTLPSSSDRGGGGGFGRHKIGCCASCLCAWCVHRCRDGFRVRGGAGCR